MEEEIGKAMFEADQPGKSWDEAGKTTKSFYTAAAKRLVAGVQEVDGVDFSSILV